jgi:transposase
VAGTSRQILKLKDALWTFAYTEGVEPTHNLAERDLRHAVIWRKTRFGTQSEDGSRFVERILTAVMSLRKQQRNVLDSLTTALEAQLQGTPRPRCCPTRHLATRSQPPDPVNAYAMASAVRAGRCRRSGFLVR